MISTLFLHIVENWPQTLLPNERNSSHNRRSNENQQWTKRKGVAKAEEEKV